MPQGTTMAKIEWNSATARIIRRSPSKRISQIHLSYHCHLFNQDCLTDLETVFTSEDYDIVFRIDYDIIIYASLTEISGALRSFFHSNELCRLR